MVNTFLQKYKYEILDTFKLSLPIIFGRLGAVLMGVLDNMMIGRLGYEELAAAGIANAIFILVAIMPIGFLIVGSPMVASSYSQSDKKESVNILKGCIQSSVLLSVFFQCLLLVFAFNFQWFGQPHEVEVLAIDFFYWVIASTLPLMVFIAIEQFTDGLSYPSISMFFNVTGLFVNAGINWLLIYGHWGFPQFGVVGAGIGTFIARTYMCIGIWLVVKYKAAFKEFELKINLFEIDWPSFNRILKNGIPSGLQFFFEVSAFSLAAVMVGWLGVIPLAAHNIAISVASVTYMLSSGFATGGSIRVGTAFGLKDREGVLKATKSALFLVTFLMVISCFSFIVFNQFFVNLYTNEPKVVEVASGLLILAGLFQLGDGIQVVSMRALLGIEDVNSPTIITLCAYWVIGIPIGSLLCFYFDWGVYGMWTGLVIGLSLSAVLLTFRIFNKINQI